MYLCLSLSQPAYPGRGWGWGIRILLFLIGGPLEPHLVVVVGADDLKGMIWPRGGVGLTLVLTLRTEKSWRGEDQGQ